MVKPVSLLLTIAMISVYAFALFGNTLAKPFFNYRTESYGYAFAVDQLGNVYFIDKKPDMQSLVVLDSIGEAYVETEITPYFEGEFFIDNIFVQQNKSIWLIGYLYDPASLMISGVKIVSLREDGSFIGDIYETEMSLFKDSLYPAVSSISEDERNVYFAFDTIDGLIDVYSVFKDNSEPMRKIARCNPRGRSGTDIIAFHALPGGDVVVSFSDGSVILYDRLGKLNDIDVPAGVNIDRFFPGAGGFYMRDAVNGTVYSSSASEPRAVPVLQGSFSIEDGNNTFKDFHEIAVSGIGNVLGVLHTENGTELYLGGFTFLPKITDIIDSSSAGIMNWIALVAAVCGVILVSVLIWEFFVRFMQTHMSLIFQQLLLTSLVIVTAFYIMSEYVLVPNISSAISESAHDSLISDANVFLSALNTSVQDSPASGYSAFVRNFGDEFNLNGGDKVPLGVYLIAGTDSGYGVAASSDKHPSGIALNIAFPYREFSKFSAPREDGSVFEVMTNTGKRLVFIKPADFKINGFDSLLCVMKSMTGYESAATEINRKVNLFLFAVGAILLLLLILIIVFHVVALRRLNSVLRSFVMGKYDSAIPDVISDGETGDMHTYVAELAGILKMKEENIQTLNTFYRRFIPQQFLNLFGKSGVEQIEQNLRAKSEESCIAFICYEIEKGHLRDGDVIQTVNAMLENIIPVITRFGGTAYNFSSGGFEAVFDSGAVNAMSAVLAIRDTHTRLKKQNTVDLRAVLIKSGLDLGFYGNQNRMELAAISDNYQIAESLIRTCFNSNIYVCAAGQICSEIKTGDIHIRVIGDTAVFGGSVKLCDIYESDPPLLFEMKKSFAGKFELGVNLFEKGDYRNARKMFMDIVKHSAEDGISGNYLYLSEYNVNNQDKQRFYTAFENESLRSYFGKRSDAYYSNTNRGE